MGRGLEETFLQKKILKRPAKHMTRRPTSPTVSVRHAQLLSYDQLFGTPWTVMVH